MFVTKKAFMMFDLKRENKIVAFVKRNPELVTLALGLAVGLFMPEAQAAGLDFLGTRLKTKLTDIAKVFNTTAGAAGVLGFGWFVFTLFRGEPSYRLAGSLLIGSVLLAMSGQICTWLGN